MAATHGKDAKTYVNGYDLSSALRSEAPDMTADVAETTGQGVSSKTYVVGQKDATLALDGIFYGGTDEADQALQAAFGTSTVVVCWMPEGDAAGKLMYGFKGTQTSYGPTTTIDDAAKFTAALQSDVAAERGVVLHALAAESATGNDASHNNTASTANGGAAYLQVTAATGGSWSVVAQDSADNITFADIATFASFTGRTKERVAIAGTIRQHTRTRRVAPGGSATYFSGITRN